ncbi:Phosphate ABC transporter, periplasmic phosphate-binding protein pstS [Collimonas fungivorans Ter331]|uniref:Phosphate ABC transporter, periplasmic phosphate-binding protein pstS n=1 Tax=Collimonas fungivorans (strain Ter331) TaxID=1005048 RepID=G0AEH4_COLFT|nr:Phosphate ABC transporter, periplasmic phosphate-binding protein pstS [Collimonas fungivorans Ter331]
MKIRSMYLRSASATLFSVFGLMSTLAQADVRISGSDTEENLITTAVTQYQRGSKSDIKAEFKGTSVGFKDLCKGAADIVPASNKIQADQAKACADKKISYLELPIAYDAVAVIVNKANNWTNDLTMAELKSIFHPESYGKVTHWNQVRMAYSDAPLKIVSPDTKSGTTMFFTERVNAMRGFLRGDTTIFSDHGKIIDAVSEDVNAIGFVSLGALVERKSNVRPVPINFGKGAVIPDASSVLSEAYGPLTRLLYVYIAQSALAKPEVTAFASYLFENGDRYARFSGFVPLTAAGYINNLRRIKAGQ